MSWCFVTRGRDEGSGCHLHGCQREEADLMEVETTSLSFKQPRAQLELFSLSVVPYCLALDATSFQEVSSTLGPDQPFPGSARAHLVHFGPHGTFGFIISKMDVLGSFLQSRRGVSGEAFQGG